MNEILEKQFIEMVSVCQELGEHENEYYRCEKNINNLEYQIKLCEMPTIGKVIVGILSFMFINVILGLTLGWLLEKIIALYFVILIVLVTISIKFITKQYNQFKEKEKISFLEGIEEEKKKLEEIKMNMSNTWILNKRSFEGMPEDYVYSIAIEEMHKYVQHGRANTIPEAINLYEEQLHRWKIEEQNGMLIDSQYRQEKRLKNIEFYSALSAFFD